MLAEDDIVSALPLLPAALDEGVEVFVWDVRRRLQMGELHWGHVGRQLNGNCFQKEVAKAQ